MILAILTVTMYAAGGAAVLILTGAGLWLLAAGFRARQRRIGYGCGLRDGLKQGYRKGEAAAALRQVLTTPTVDDHFAGALLSGALHEPAGEEMASLLGAVQELERVARTEATS